MSNSEKNNFGGVTNKQWNWKPSGLLEYSPLFVWPFNIVKFLSWFKETYLSISIRVIVLFLSLGTWYFTMPALERCVDFKYDWILEIFLRNLVLMFFVAGTLHLYFYSYKKQGLKLKFDPRDLSRNSKVFAFNNQVLDNMYYSVVYGVSFWSILEVMFMWLFANQHISMMTWSQSPTLFVLIIIVTPIWHSFHFYWIHRALHWKPVYNKVHSLHHKNVNVGPWSGMSMHPIEIFIYLTSVFIHLVITSNPFHIIYHLQFMIFNAVIAHSGFDGLVLNDKKRLSLGRFHHQLHHRHFECNYGNAEMPWDKWFKTFHDGSDNAMADIRKNRIL